VPAIARDLTRHPDALIRALFAGEEPAAPIGGVHIYAFGGLRRTALWRRARLAEDAVRGSVSGRSWNFLPRGATGQVGRKSAKRGFRSPDLI
jgi:hypothetical protein